MYMMLLVGVIVAFSLTATQSIPPTDTPYVCEQFHDVKLENQSVFAAPSPAETGDGREHGVINMPIRWHIISNDRFVLESRAKEVNNWIEKQLENSSQSMSHRWSNKMAVKIADMKFKIYLTESVKTFSLQEFPYFENITIINSTVLNLLGSGRVCRNYDLIEEKFHGTFIHLSNTCPERYYIIAPPYFATPCEQLRKHWKWVCNPLTFFLRKGDIFWYNYTAINHSVITEMHRGFAALTDLLYFSNNSMDNFTMINDIDGPFVIRILNITGKDELLDELFTVNMIKKCEHINDFATYWKDYLNPRHINIIISSVILEPTIQYGVFEYGINLSDEAPSIILLKSINDNIEVDDESLWAHLSKIFGASIREEGMHIY